jgi:hypothetical protein
VGRPSEREGAQARRAQRLRDDPARRPELRAREGEGSLLACGILGAPGEVVAILLPERHDQRSSMRDGRQ